ncbi:acyl-CoA dehydrogenase family protein [Pararobbsia silviterrae]|uniref:Acyl-CoA dehydrogenase n=1 Tax=Pararobbsia silviterrae TaxID=1792498 RepID=A0A494XSG2_9BURK|nr:acyl-CoA dehydrogenase family protein [Pararobbsia silviterrae]RKP53582.1 acyl-CoA dehydrogenase [Pararobbsia silviterrae]
MDAGGASGMTTRSLPPLDARLRDWLDAYADALDDGSAAPESVMPALAQAGQFSIGVPDSLGGTGGAITDAILAVASVAARSLTAAFVFWGQRTFIEYLLQSPNTGLRDRLLPALLDGRHAGATGLSNAMKYLGGIESLQIRAVETGHALDIEGTLPWVTNLRKEGFVVAAVAGRANGQTPVIVAIPHDAPGVSRSDDLDLVAMRSSNTAAIDLARVALDDSWIIAVEAMPFLARVRPAFLGLQCGLSIGLAQRCLDEARRAADALSAEIDTLDHRLATVTQRLLDGVASGVFRAHAAPLFEIRIELAAIASAAAALEIQSAGGRGYLRPKREDREDLGNAAPLRASTHAVAQVAAPAPMSAPPATRDGGVARRWREAAFIPVVTPSLTQLKLELARRATSTAA